MKKFFLIAVMGMLFIIGLSSMVSMDPPPNTTCNEQCNYLVSLGIFSNHGACMGACNPCINPAQNSATFAVCICQQIDDIEGLQNAGFENMGACVTTLKRN